MESFTANLVSRVEVDACPEGPLSGVRLLLSAGQGDFLHVVARHALPRGQAHFATWTRVPGDGDKHVPPSVLRVFPSDSACVRVM